MIGEEELPFNRKTAIFFYCCQGFGKTTTTKLLLRCLVIPLKFVVVKISSEKWQEDPDVGKFAKLLTGVIAGAANPWLLARTSEQSQIHPEFTFFPLRIYVYQMPGVGSARECHFQGVIRWVYSLSVALKGVTVNKSTVMTETDAVALKTATTFNYFHLPQVSSC